MLLICPSCRTRYIVPDAAIGTGGRQVRCASCKHSWYQPALELDLTSSDESGLSGDGVLASRIPVEEPAPPPITPPRFERDEDSRRSSFAHEPPFRPRRNPAKLWTMAAILFALLLGAAGLAVWQSGWLDGGIDFAQNQPALEIVLDDTQDRQTLSDGTEYFAASGTIVNKSAVSQRVPAMLVVLKDAQGRPVYNWTMNPPVRTLAPGAKAAFNEAKLDVPRSATELFIGWAPEAG